MARLLFLCKRRPQQRDLLTRPYGRFHHLPVGLARRGHAVDVALLSHRRLPSESLQRDGVSWSSDDVLDAGLRAYWRRVNELCAQRRYDWIIGCSDLYYGVAATQLAAKHGTRAAIDAYDNFESYLSWAKPLHWWWHRALGRAELVTAAGPQLAALLQRHRRGTVQVLPMAADPQFVPADRAACRARLQLPLDAPLIGHCGSFTRTRGSQLLLRSFERVREQMPAARLVLTGRYPDRLAQHDGVIGLGMVPDERMPAVIGSLDVACIVLADTAFGRFSYPAKLCEAIACNVSLVASATEPARWMLGGDERFLAPLDDASAFAEKILAQLRQPAATADLPQQPSWDEIVIRCEALLTRPAP